MIVGIDQSQNTLFSQLKLRCTLARQSEGSSLCIHPTFLHLKALITESSGRLSLRPWQPTRIVSQSCNIDIAFGILPRNVLTLVTTLIPS